MIFNYTIISNWKRNRFFDVRKQKRLFYTLNTFVNNYFRVKRFKFFACAVAFNNCKIKTQILLKIIGKNWVWIVNNTIRCSHNHWNGDNVYISIEVYRTNITTYPKQFITNTIVIFAYVVEWNYFTYTPTSSRKKTINIHVVHKV